MKIQKNKQKPIIIDYLKEMENYKREINLLREASILLACFGNLFVKDILIMK